MDKLVNVEELVEVFKLLQKNPLYGKNIDIPANGYVKYTSPNVSNSFNLANMVYEVGQRDYTQGSPGELSSSVDIATWDELIESLSKYKRFAGDLQNEIQKLLEKKNM